MNCANHPDRERIAFCQNCGKPLCQECARTVGSALFCEPCLAARLGVGAPPPPAAGASTVIGGAPNLSYSAAGAIPPPGGPNPILAALLGIIPGVGAMYNGQYAKGVVHLIVFAVLVSLADQHGLFGLFIAGWVVYQVIEAYHTAQARRDGTPLPNPFGLNDIGERLGFGRSWPSAVPTSGPIPQPPSAGPVVPPSTAASAVPPPPGGYNYTYNYPPPAAWSAPWDSQAAANPYAANQPQPLDPNAPLYPPRNRFPVGAIWLIGLGLLFLIGNSGFFHVYRLVPFFLIGLGVWIFIHRMTLSGEGLADDGTAYYRVRLFSALRGSIWVILVGVMFFLASFNILSWGKSWPLFIIVAGLMIFFERTAYGSAAVSAPLYPPPPPPAAPAPPAPPTSTTPIVPTEHDQEGR